MHLYANDLISASSAITQVYTLIAFHQLKPCCSKLEAPQEGLQEEFGYENNGIGNLEDDSFLFFVLHPTPVTRIMVQLGNTTSEVKIHTICTVLCVLVNLIVRKVNLKVTKEFWLITWRKTLKNVNKHNRKWFYSCHRKYLGFLLMKKWDKNVMYVFARIGMCFDWVEEKIFLMLGMHKIFYKDSCLSFTIF